MAARTRRREEIRRAAITLFAQKGFNGTGMEDIATSLGMGTSSLYNHWRSKHALLADIMIHTMTALNDLFDVATFDGTPTQRLKRAMITHVKYHGTHPLEARIGNREITSLREPEKSRLLALRSDYAERWKDLIREGAETREFTVESISLATYALLEMGIGVAQWYHSDGPMTLNEIAHQYGQMALLQLTATTSKPHQY